VDAGRSVIACRPGGAQLAVLASCRTLRAEGGAPSVVTAADEIAAPRDVAAGDEPMRVWRPARRDPATIAKPTHSHLPADNQPRSARSKLRGLSVLLFFSGIAVPRERGRCGPGPSRVARPSGRGEITAGRARPSQSGGLSPSTTKPPRAPGRTAPAALPHHRPPRHHPSSTPPRTRAAPRSRSHRPVRTPPPAPKPPLDRSVLPRPRHTAPHHHTTAPAAYACSTNNRATSPRSTSSSSALPES
jgi:hypothetical protein